MADREEERSFEEIDLREYLKILGKWKWLIVAVILIAVGTSGILSFFVLPPVYETKTVIMVKQASDTRSVQTQADNLEEVVGAVSRLPVMTINTYINQIENELLLNKVIDDLGLDKDIYSARSLAAMIDASAVSDTNLIQIKVTNSDPQLAAKIANAVSKGFVAFISEVNQKQMTQSVDFLQNQIAQEEKQLEDVTAKLKEMQSNPRNVDYLTSETGSMIGSLAEYRSKEYSLKVQRQQMLAGQEMLRQQLQDTPQVLKQEKSVENAEAPPDSESTPAETITVEVPNPDYLALSSKLNERDFQLAELNAELLSVQQTIAQLEGSLEKLQVELADKKMSSDNLQRELSRREQTYSILLEKLTQAQLTRSIDIGETSLQVMSPAVTPVNPVKPNKRLNVAIAAVLGLMISVVLAFLLEFFDNSIKNAEDVERLLDIPVLGSIPKFSPGREN